jgi:prevent-host-death family protein
MTHEISTRDVRQRLGDLLNRVSLRHDEYVIARKGHPVAALVPVEKLEQMRRIARRHALAFLDQQKGGQLSQADAESLALEAQRWARKATRRRRK